VIPSAPNSLQPSLEDLGTPLPLVTFCVVDLETTGGGPQAAITEFGAVKVCGGQVLGEFQTLVNPQAHIPAMIAVLTGITNQMVADAPPIGRVLPSFLEFARGTVLVAHNARFDVGFLKRASEALGYQWPGNAVVDTVALARQTLMPGEVPNVKLATLADHFHTTIEPSHRALDDARATVDVLHGLLERVGNLGVGTLEDLKEFEHRVSPQRRAKRAWAQNLPEAPGVYVFFSDRPGQGRQVLYVGKSTNIRRRVRGYFTSSETRPRMDEMVRVATGVETIVCATDLEAEIRELRMIAAHSPRYNRRSKRQNKLAWVKLTRDYWPRLSVVTSVADDQATYWGPFSSRTAAETACQTLYEAYPIRQCSQRMGRNGKASSCALGEIGRCLAPCTGTDRDVYLRTVEAVREAVTSDIRPTLALVGRRIAKLSQQQRYEDAREVTERLEAFVTATTRFHRLVGLSRCEQIVAARWEPRSSSRPGWHIHVIRHGRLAAAVVAAPGQSARTMADEAVRTAETVLPTPHDLPAGSVEEAERIVAWLESPGVRLIDIRGEWSLPVHVGLDEGDLARFTLGGTPARQPAEVA